MLLGHPFLFLEIVCTKGVVWDESPYLIFGSKKCNFRYELFRYYRGSRQSMSNYARKDVVPPDRNWYDFNPMLKVR